MGLALPEAHGGLGLGTLDLALVLVELGRVAAPGPFLSTQLVAWAIAKAGTTAQRKTWLPQIAAGETIADARAGRGKRSLGRRRHRHAGEARTAADTRCPAPSCSCRTRSTPMCWSSPARTAGQGPDGVTLFLVDAGHAGPRRSGSAATTMDRHPQALRGAASTTWRVGRRALLGERGQGWPLLVARASIAPGWLCPPRVGGAAAGARDDASSTPRCASNSASRSAASRRCSTSAPT